VEDAIGPDLTHGAHRRLGIVEVGDDEVVELVSEITTDLRSPDADNLGAGPQTDGREVAPDKARDAGYEDAHPGEPYRLGSRRRKTHGSTWATSPTRP
jgi:hypothetical protein